MVAAPGHGLEPRSPRTRTIATAILVGAACYLGASFGTTLRFPQIGTAVLFPPYAILTAALLLSPPRRWSIYLVAAGLADVWPHWRGGDPLSFVLLAELANFARALVAAAGARRFAHAPERLHSLRGMVAFLLFATVLAPLTGAFLCAAVVAIHQGADRYWPVWRAWLLSNTLTGLTLLPISLISRRRLGARAGPRASLIGCRRRAEGTVLALALVTVGAFLLLAPPGQQGGFLVLPYAPLPLLLWAAVRFGPLGTCASLLLITGLAIGGTLAGRGPFVTASPAADMLRMQLFLFATSVPLLLLSALIQEQQRTARALRASRQRYRAVVEDQTELICRFRPDGTLTFVNGACCRRAGLSAAQLRGTPFWSLLPADRRPVTQQAVAGLHAACPLTTWEHELVSDQGERRWEQWRVRALFDPQGQLVHCQAVGRDVTERKLAVEEHHQLRLQQAATEALRESDRRKDEFLATLGHELRNPLGAISMGVELLRQLPPGEDQTWARELIGRQVTQLTRMIDDLLDLSRISQGKLQLHLQTVDLGQVVAAVLDTCRPAIAAGQLGLSVRVPPAALPLRGDPVRLGQLVTNLLNNAAKYTQPGGQIDLSVTEEHGQLVLRVTDTGAGIPAAMLTRVFEAFAQVDVERDAALGGLGLGLSLVKRLVELHGGTVEAHSEGPGHGSSFVVRLPTLPATASAPAPVDAATPAGRPSPGEALHRVLVVDDAVDAADTLAMFLRLQGCEVSVAYDGVDGLAAAIRTAPELVFLDLALPGMDGLEVARRLRSQFDGAHMRLVATTGFGQPDDRRRIQEAGFDQHLTKPIDAGALRSVLASL